MTNRKLKNCKCIEIECRDCPLDTTKMVSCSVIVEDSLTFGESYKKLKKVVDLLEKDLEKEILCNKD